MSCRNIVQELTLYNRARLKFCQVIGECASRPQNIPYMQHEGIIELLQPLLTDPEMAIRSNSVCCFSRMANHSAQVANELIERKIPETMLHELIVERNNNLHYRRAVLQAMKAISKHSAETAAQIVECGGLSACLVCLEEQDVLLKEAACCGIGCIVRSSGQLAMTALSKGAATLLVLCLQMNELNIRQVATLALGDIAQHSAVHAQAVCEAGAATSLVRMVDQSDAKLKRQALNSLANIASHSGELAEAVVNCDIFPKILIHLGHESVHVQRQAIRLVVEITKHSLDLAQTVVNAGGVLPLIQCVFSGANMEEDIITPAAMALGYIAGQSPHFALAIIESKGVMALGLALDAATGKRTQAQLAACVWALGHIGRHSSEHCKALADAQVFGRILELYDNPSNSDDLRQKCRGSMMSCFQCCLDVGALEPLIYSAPPDILAALLRQLAKVLPKDAGARRLFQTVGGLKKIQDLQTTASAEIVSLIGHINSCYSEEVIKYYVNGGSTTAAGGASLGGGGGGGGGGGLSGSQIATPRPSQSMLLATGGGGDNDYVSQRFSFKKPQDFFVSDGEAMSTERSGNSNQSGRNK